MPSLKTLLAAPAAAALFAAAPAAAQSPCGDSYTVQRGDTLYSIAQRCRVPMGAIVAANSFVRSPSRIEVGWRLAIPGGEPPRAEHPHDDDRHPEGERWRRDPDGRWRPAPPGPPSAPPPRRGHPQAPDSRGMQVTGVITREGVECPALRSDRGELFTLAGDIGRFAPGDRVTVRGPVAEVSFCQQGTTIEVHDIRPASWRR